eukprot:1991148-Rhodomonas_salina.1
MGVWHTKSNLRCAKAGALATPQYCPKGSVTPRSHEARGNNCLAYPVQPEIATSSPQCTTKGSTGKNIKTRTSQEWGQKGS